MLECVKDDDAIKMSDEKTMREVMKDADAWSLEVGLAVAIAMRDVGDALARFIAPESLEGFKDADVEEMDDVPTRGCVETILGGSACVFDRKTRSVRLGDRVEACRRCVEETLTSSSTRSEEDAERSTRLRPRREAIRLVVDRAVLVAVGVRRLRLCTRRRGRRTRTQRR